MPLVLPYDRGSPQYARGYWRACFDAPAYAELFDTAKTEEFHDPWERAFDTQGLEGRLLSLSYLTEQNLKGQEREDFLIKLRQHIADSEKEWIDKDKGMFKYHFVTDTYILRKKAA